MSEESLLIGEAHATHQPSQSNSRTEVYVCICDKKVPTASPEILGRCEYYYRPLHDEYVEKSGVSVWDLIKNWAQMWNPFDDEDIYRKLLEKRDKLIPAESFDSDWSRHASFMVRHVGCGHVPPDYYVSYGYYYCSTYGEKLNPRLSHQGQEWLRKARKKLQENMEDGLAENMRGDEVETQSKSYPNKSSKMVVPQFELEVTPKVFKIFAFNTHVPAYLDAGLADLPILDLARIGGQPNLEEWLDKETWKQAFKSGDEVLGQKYRNGKISIEEVIDSLMRHLSW